ncbi:MAG: hypothetical protein WC291_08045 [Thermodesulfovibrionales bacterium]
MHNEQAEQAVLIDLNSWITKLRSARTQATLTNHKLDESRRSWALENEALLARQKSEAQEVTDAEAQVRALTLDAYWSTGSKKPAEGVGVRIGQALTYREDQAKSWAVQHDHQKLLKLDKSAFEKAAKALQLDFVKFEVQATATIAKEL